MTKFYAIKIDEPKYQTLDLDVLDVISSKPDTVSMDDIYNFCERNFSMKSWWKTPATVFMDSEDGVKGLMPDICGWVRSSVVLSPKAHRILGGSLEQFGELLPVQVHNETYFIFNCLTFGEADEENCDIEYSGGVQTGLNKLKIKESAVDLLVFKCELESSLTLYCGDRFRDIVEQYGLTGISFDEELVPDYR